MTDPNALTVFVIGAVFGIAVGVPLGRWSLLLLFRWSRQQQRRQRVEVGQGAQLARVNPRVEVEHAGEYLQHQGARARWTQLDPPGQMARLRGTRLSRAEAGVNSAGPN